MLEAGVQFSVISTIRGWSASTTTRMVKRYGHIGQAAQREAVKALDRADFDGVVHQTGNQISAAEKGKPLTH